MKAENVDVVTDVADDADVLRRRDVDDAADEARTADASREDDDLQGAVPVSTACVRGPQRS